MREIEFKAKRLHINEWVFGSLYVRTVDNIVKYYIIENVNRPWRRVTPETVCQWTGLLDKHGAKIFDGDIVIFGKLFTAIKYFEKYGMFGLVGKSKYREFDENEPMGSGGSSTSYKPYVLSEYYQKRIEVVGNIHDKEHQKQAIIDMMSGDEELGLYDE